MSEEKKLKILVSRTEMFQLLEMEPHSKPLETELDQSVVICHPEHWAYKEIARMRGLIKS